jgi:hypothetical protein
MSEDVSKMQRVVNRNILNQIPLQFTPHSFVSETGLVVGILEAFCQCCRNSVTCLESGTDIARVRPWNERDGPHPGVQKAEAQFKVAASVSHVTAQI